MRHRVKRSAVLIYVSLLLAGLVLTASAQMALGKELRRDKRSDYVHTEVAFYEAHRDNAGTPRSHGTTR